MGRLQDPWRGHPDASAPRRPAAGSAVTRPATRHGARVALCPEQGREAALHIHRMSAPLLAQVDVRGDRAFVTALAEAPNGMWKVQDWVREARADASPDELGRLVEAALARS